MGAAQHGGSTATPIAACCKTTCQALVIENRTTDTHCKVGALPRQAAVSTTVKTNRESEANMLLDHKLLVASQVGQVTQIREAVAKGADLEARISLIARRRQERGDDEEIQEVLVLEQRGIFYPGGFGVPDAQQVSLDQGLTPLMRAAKHGSAGAVSVLLELRANLHAQAPDGSTPLHLAASFGCRRICMSLLAANANPHVLDNAYRDAYACLPDAAQPTGRDEREWRQLLRPRGGCPLTNSTANHTEQPAAERVRQPVLSEIAGREKSRPAAGPTPQGTLGTTSSREEFIC